MKVQAVQGSKVVGTATASPTGPSSSRDCQRQLSPGAAGLELPRSVGRDRLARCNARDADPSCIAWIWTWTGFAVVTLGAGWPPPT